MVVGVVYFMYFCVCVVVGKDIVILREVIYEVMF